MISQYQRDKILNGEASETTLKSLGLRGRGAVFLFDTTCVRYITRSSRFLRKDAEAFAAIVQQVSAVKDTAFNGHVIIQKAPVCSKAKLWLEERSMTIETLY